jgi:mannosyltransferase OCH1-like enzyme
MKKQTPSKMDLLPPVSEGIDIPKIIHQTFFSGKGTALPPEIEQNIQRIKASNPDWEYRFYDDSDIILFIRENYGDRILSFFLRIDPTYGAARADLFRYLCIYKCGGVYIDIKSTLQKPLDSVIKPDDRFLLSQWENKPGEPFDGWGRHPATRHIPGGEYQQWHVAAAPGHPFLKAVLQRVLQNIELYDPRRHGSGKWAVMELTGPAAYTLAIEPIRSLHPHRLLNISRDAGFQYSIYSTGASQTHLTLFKKHYSKSVKPVVRVAKWKEIQWYILKLYSLIFRNSRLAEAYDPFLHCKKKVAGKAADSANKKSS